MERRAQRYLWLVIGKVKHHLDLFLAVGVAPDRVQGRKFSLCKLICFLCVFVRTRGVERGIVMEAVVLTCSLPSVTERWRTTKPRDYLFHVIQIAMCDADIP